MKNVLTVVAMAALAGTALASPVSGGIDRSGYTIYAAEASEIGSPVTRGVSQTVYSDMAPGAGGFVAFAAPTPTPNGALATLGTADYTSTAQGDFDVTSFRFVGGVDAAGGVIFVDFFDSTGAFVDGFGTSLSQAGRFIWTITLTTAVSAADAGFVRLSVDDENLAGAGSSTTGQWFLGNAGATVGNAGAPEANPTFNFNFELNTIPTPGALAIAGLGGLVAARRRRA